MGVFFTATGNGNNIGIYAEGLTACTTATCPNLAGQFNGDVVSTTGFFVSSDSSIKENIANIPNALSTINQLQPKAFTYKQNSYPQLSLSFGSHFGLIAQDVELLYPHFVKTVEYPEKKDNAGNILYPAVNIKSIKYEEFIPLTIQGIKEQQIQIQMQQAQIQAQQQQIDSLITALTITPKVVDPNGEEPSKGSIELEDINRIILEQNDPNPFDALTRINYEIPDAFTKASIVFFNDQGKMINSYPITSKGKGVLEVTGSKLRTGLYTYSLVVDGKIIESKKMVKAE